MSDDARAQSTFERACAALSGGSPSPPPRLVDAGASSPPPRNALSAEPVALHAAANGDGATPPPCTPPPPPPPAAIRQESAALIDLGTIEPGAAVCARSPVLVPPTPHSAPATGARPRGDGLASDLAMLFDTSFGASANGGGSAPQLPAFGSLRRTMSSTTSRRLGASRISRASPSETLSASRRRPARCQAVLTPGCHPSCQALCWTRFYF